ncbi:MAG: phosphate ABC transporter permease subunit PstC [Chlorobiales bacterium]|nr:phosphate ABC transporter permease subunit PstC [Chlorobiales bacterium]
MSISEAKQKTPARKIGLKKRFRFGETLAEYFIKSVAFTSFITIILIFAFVFRESSGIFFYTEKQKATPAEVQQETYGGGSDQQETYSGSDQQETYGGVVEQQETYGDVQVPAEKPFESAGKPEGATSSLENLGGQDKVTAENLLGSKWEPISYEPKFGLLPLILGSFKVTIIAVLIGAPLSILAALYTAFFAPKRLKIYLKVAIEFLSGFPSVIIGFFALVEIATLFQYFFGYEYRLNAFIGGFALSLVAIPVIYTVTDDAINAIPKELTEASLALGATKWQTAFLVVLPAATPGVFAAVLLGIGRAFGETMIVLMATGNAALMSLSFFKPVRTLSATIGAEMAEVVFGDTHYNVLFFIGTILFIFTFTLVAVAEFYVRGRLMRRFRGES